MSAPVTRTLLSRLGHGVLVLLGAGFGTTLLFMVLPLLETITEPPKSDLLLTETSVADVPPPPAPPEEEEEPEQEEPESPPPADLTEEAPPLDLSQLELALNPVGGGGGWGAVDFGLKLGSGVANGPAKDEQASDALFALADLDQPPRVVHQPSPSITAEMRKKAPGKVVLVFVVNQDGRVEEPKVMSASDPVFERAAVAAVKQWKFEPGKKAGRPVRFRMRVPLSF